MFNNNIIVKSLTSKMSVQSLYISQSSIRLSVERGSFLSIFLGATRFDASNMDVAKLVVVGSIEPLIW